MGENEKPTKNPLSFSQNKRKKRIKQNNQKKETINKKKHFKKPKPKNKTKKDAFFRKILMWMFVLYNVSRGHYNLQNPFYSSLEVHFTYT